MDSEKAHSLQHLFDIEKKVYHLNIMKPLDVFSKFKRQIDSLNLLVIYYFHPEAESQFTSEN